jgi:glycosyltransferase involved in cell wall biosynthesis
LKILVISPSAPLPIGPTIRLYYALSALVRDHEVDMICGDFDSILGSMLNASDVRKQLGLDGCGVRKVWIISFSRVAAWLRAGFGWLRGTPMRIAFCGSPGFAREIGKRLRQEKYDLIWAHFGRMEPFVRGLSLPVIVDLHDSMSLRHASFAEIEKNPAKRFVHQVESRREARHEAELIARGYHLLVNGTADARHLQRAGADTSQITVLPTPVESEKLQASEADPSFECTILFSGQMSYFPNQDAVVFFHDRILPLILAENPKATFCVVGAHPPKRILRLARDPRIKVTGFVPDLGAYIKQAQVVVVPLRCGAGISMKILQALALRRPVVATSFGARGLDVEPGKHLLLADRPEDFARKVNMLLKDAAMRSRLGNEGCALVRSRYSRDAVFHSLQDLVARVARKENAILTQA